MRATHEMSPLSPLRAVRDDVGRWRHCLFLNHISFVSECLSLISGVYKRFDKQIYDWCNDLAVDLNIEGRFDT